MMLSELLPGDFILTKRSTWNDVYGGMDYECREYLVISVVIEGSRAEIIFLSDARELRRFRSMSYSYYSASKTLVSRFLHGEVQIFRGSSMIFQSNNW